MTTQATDSIIFNNNKYSILKTSGKLPHEPIDFGLKLKALTSANWRGHTRTYLVKNKELFFEELTANERTGASIPINGILPTDNKGVFHYQNLNMHAKYSGSILIAHSLAKGYPIHEMNYDPFMFETVFELEFNEGKLINSADLSSKFETTRQLYQKLQTFDLTEIIKHIAWMQNDINYKYSQDFTPKINYHDTPKEYGTPQDYTGLDCIANIRIEKEEYYDKAVDIVRTLIPELDDDNYWLNSAPDELTLVCNYQQLSKVNEVLVKNGIRVYEVSYINPEYV